MNKISFPTIKLSNHIKQVTLKVKNSNVIQDDLIVYGVTNTKGIEITNNKPSDDLGNYIILGENQFAYNPYRINVGSIGLSKKGQLGVVSPAYVVFECLDSIDSEFLLYYLKSSLGINLIKWYGDRGGVRSALRFSDLKNIDFPAIDIQKQKQILNKIKSLDKCLSEFNSQLNETEIANLRQSILQQAIEGKLVAQDSNDEPASVLLEKIKAEKGQLIKEKRIKKQKDLPPINDEEKPFELPQGWEWCRWQDILSFDNDSMKRGPFGSALVKSFFVPKGDETFKVYEQKNAIYNNSFIGDYYITKDKYKDMIGFSVFAGDMIISCSGVTLGKIAKLDQNCEQGIINQALLKIKLNKECVYDEYFLKLFRSKFFQDKIFDKAKGSAIPNMVGVTELKKMLIPLPPLAEQQRIVEKVDSLMALCDELEQEVKTAKKYASQLMEAVLQEAFTEPHTKADGANVVEFDTLKTTKANLTELTWKGAARDNISKDTWEEVMKDADDLFNEDN